MKKICSTCKKSYPLDEMVKSKRSKDGYSSRCKNCHREKCFKYISNNPDKRKDSCIKYYLNNKEKCNASSVKWQKSNPDKVKTIKDRCRINNSKKIKAYRKKFGYESTRKLRAMYPNRYKARNKVNNAIARGVLPRSSECKCAYCGKAACEYHHHKGYDEKFWLDVVPVCKPCHAENEKKVEAA